MPLAHVMHLVPKRKPEPLQGTSVKHRVLNRSQGHLSACVLNLGHWERSRKRSTHHLTDWDATCAEHGRDPICGNLFLHFLSNISAHVPQEAGTFRQQEREVMEQHGWMTAASPDKMRLCGIQDILWPGCRPRHQEVRKLPCRMLSLRLALVKSLGEKIGREQACPATRKLLLREDNLARMNCQV